MKQVRYTFLDRLRIPKIDSSDQMQIASLAFDREQCRECGICVSLCVFGCLETDKAGKKDFMAGTARGGNYGVPRLETTHRNANYCFACYCCGAACPHGAITIRQSYSPGYRFKRLTQTTELSYPKRY